MRRRRLGQNFLSEAAAEVIIAAAEIGAGELVLDIGAGRGAFAFPLARRGARVLAIEPDPVWAARLRAAGSPNVRVIERDFLTLPLPREPFRAIGSLPFSRTTDILRRLLDDPRTPLTRADVIVQWEVAQKRAKQPPDTLISTQWAPWWEVRLGARIPAKAFRPVPRVDGGVLVITRRAPLFLPASMAPAFARFVRAHWPFE